MRLVVARCAVDYRGRLAAHLPLATRLIMIKADGSVLVHSDAGGYKPLMWMTPPCTLAVSTGPGCTWTVTNRAGEALAIEIDEILADWAHDLGIDPGLRKDGVEAHLQELLAANCTLLGDGVTLVKREYPTDIGPVDLLCRDPAGTPVIVEIKRRAEIDGVEQVTRYLQRLSTVLPGLRGVLAAQTFAPQARVLAADRGIGCLTLDYDLLRDREPDIPRLF